MADQPHYFHAEAHALSGRIDLPFKQDIKKQAFVKLEGRLADLTDEQRAQRNYFSQHAKNFRLEGIISYSAAHTQVSGHESRKFPGASVTLATSLVEDLNILNVVTADRIVAQVSTTHFPNVYAPRVTFLGTHFEGLRIARHKVEPFLNLGLVGKEPGGKSLYVEAKTFVAAVKSQYKNLKEWMKGLEGELKTARSGADDGSLRTQYHWGDPKYDQIKEEAIDAREEDLKTGRGKSSGITCSLVEDIEIEPIKGPSGESEFEQLTKRKCGHVIHVPDFGTIFLAELTVKHDTFHLSMIRVEMGCLASGSSTAGACTVNGGGKPPAP
jgi:hypothetical protein